MLDKSYQWGRSNLSAIFPDGHETFLRASSVGFSSKNVHPLITFKSRSKNICKLYVECAELDLYDYSCDKLYVSRVLYESGYLVMRIPLFSVEKRWAYK